jgi:trigger factor
MDIIKHNIDPLNAEITISVKPADYEERINEGIKKMQKKINMPGFRPGKVPQGLIRKQYGTDILIDELNKLLHDSIHKYIEDNNIEILGNPMPKEQAGVDFTNQKDFEFVYQLGLVPDFKLDLNNEQVFTYKTVKVDDELVNKYVKDTQRNYGTPAHPEVAGEKDVLFVDFNELEVDENGQSAIKAGGVFKSDSIRIEQVKNETAKAKLLGAKKGDIFVFNVNDLFATAIEKNIGLGIDKETAEQFNSDIQITVKNISRMEEAELNQDLFDKLYGAGVITSEEQFREKVREELATMFKADSERMFRNEVKKKLTEETAMELPDAFLKRWLITMNEKPITEEELEKDYPEYAKSLRWQLIENRIIKNFEIKVEAAEVKEEAKNFIRNEYARYGQAAPEDSISKIADDILSKEKEARKIYENLYSQKVVDVIKDKCSLEEKEVAYADFFKA